MTMPHAMPRALLHAYREAMRIGRRVGNARTDGRTDGADASKTNVDTSSTETRAPVQDFDISTRQVRRPKLAATKAREAVGAAQQPRDMQQVIDGHTDGRKTA